MPRNRQARVANQAESLAVRTGGHVRTGPAGDETLEHLDRGRWVNFDDALSRVALTAALLADRYHTLREVKRQVGGMRRAEASAEPASSPS